MNVTAEVHSDNPLNIKHIVMLVIAASTVLANGFIIFVLLRQRQLQKKFFDSNSSMLGFFISLSCVNFLIGLVFVPLYVIAETLSVGARLCLVAMSLSGTQIVLGAITLFSVTLERYLRLVHPFRHRKWVTEVKVKWFILATWLYSYLFGLLPTMGWNALGYYTNSSEVIGCRFDSTHTGQYLGLMYLLHVVPSMLIMPFLYGHLLWTINSMLRRRVSLATLPALHHQGLNANSAKPLSVYAISNTRQLKNNRKWLRLMVALFITFLLSWLPLAIWYAVLFKGFTLTFLTVEDRVDNPLPVVYYVVAVSLGVGNAVITPFVFGLGHVQVRGAVYNTLAGCFKCCHSQQQANHTSDAQCGISMSTV